MTQAYGHTIKDYLLDERFFITHKLLMTRLETHFKARREGSVLIRYMKRLNIEMACFPHIKFCYKHIYRLLKTLTPELIYKKI